MKKTKQELENEYTFIHECVDNTKFETNDIKLKVLECIAKAFAYDLESFYLTDIYRENNL